MRLRLRRAVSSRIVMSAALPLAVVVIVVAASVLSWLPGAASGGPVGGPQGDGPGARTALAGVFGSGQGGTDGTGPTDAGTVSGPGPAAPGTAEPGTADWLASNRFHPVAVNAADRSTIAPAAAVSLPFLSDGTLVKPIAVNTAIADGSALLTTYKVRAGDSLTGIANRFGVSMMTVMWANNLKTAAAVHTGQVLTIPPVNGVVLSVHEGDTLASIAASYSVPADKIYKLNGLQDTALVVGQTLILPGAVESAPAAPRTIVKPLPRISKPITGPGSNPIGTPPGPVVRPPAHYGGGKFAWPVVGGNNYISQYFHSGHYAIDIAGDYGSKVVAAGDGIVTFAGWKNNGGGYQVWIAHGDNLFTTYNHMSAITVGTGETVTRGEQVGRTGQSGNATGPHLHFEVWRGPIWNGGTRVNPLLYL